MITQERLKELLHYDPESGFFTRLVGVNQFKIGDIAGSKRPDGYICIKVDNKPYQAHRLAFMWTEGFFPEHQVEHKNRVRHDNRWCNIVHATQRCNSQNCNVSSNNTSGFPGVFWYETTKKWLAQATLNRKRNHLGYYTTRLEAALARYTWEQNCSEWSCVQDSELVKAIKAAWPEFKAAKLISQESQQ